MAIPRGWKLTLNLCSGFGAVAFDKILQTWRTRTAVAACRNVGSTVRKSARDRSNSILGKIPDGELARFPLLAIALFIQAFRPQACILLNIAVVEARKSRATGG
jgi:hypothetical protein